jgi:voltage-gated potassium channel
MVPLWHRLLFFLSLLFILTLSAAVGFSIVEGLPLGDAIYFGIVTVTTVGYGDIHPTNSWGKIIAVMLIFGGVGTFTAVVANATELFLAKREQQARIQKLNLIVGVFFSEMGIDLLARLSLATKKFDKLKEFLQIKNDWSSEDFKLACKSFCNIDLELEIQPEDLREWRRLLKSKGDFLLRLLENPSLLEHELFSDLLRSIFHLREELVQRKQLEMSSMKDRTHLAGDVERVYVLLVKQWMEYMEHLAKDYPYLFSLASRRNPFQENTTVEIA